MEATTHSADLPKVRQCDGRLTPLVLSPGGVKNSRASPVVFSIQRQLRHSRVTADLASIGASTRVVRHKGGDALCYDYGVQWDIKFNPQKSQAAAFGGNSPPVSVKLGDAALGWVSNVKYLGCYFLSRSCEVDTTRCVGKCYGSFNILNVIGKRVNDMLAVHLIKTYCLLL